MKVQSRSRSWHDFEIFLHLPQYKLSSRISQLCHKVLRSNYSCGLSTATIEYSCPSACLSACMRVCLSVCVQDYSKNNGSIDLKLEHIVVCENSSDKFDIGHCPIKVKVMA